MTKKSNEEIDMKLLKLRIEIVFYKPVIDERDKIMSKLPVLAEFLKKLLNSIENDNSVKIIFPWDDKYD